MKSMRGNWEAFLGALLSFVELYRALSSFIELCFGRIFSFSEAFIFRKKI
jgi:hypothetical protein